MQIKTWRKESVKVCVYCVTPYVIGKQTTNSNDALSIYSVSWEELGGVWTRLLSETNFNVSQKMDK